MNKVLRVPSQGDKYVIPVPADGVKLGDCLIMVSDTFQSFYNGAIYDGTSWKVSGSGIDSVDSTGDSSLTVTSSARETKLAFVPGPNH